MIVEIGTKTPFHGYKNNSRQNESKILRDVFKKGDAYFNSGDLFTLDKEYFVYFADRIGDTFRCVEQTLPSSEAVGPHSIKVHKKFMKSFCRKRVWWPSDENTMNVLCIQRCPFLPSKHARHSSWGKLSAWMHPSGIFFLETFWKACINTQIWTNLADGKEKMCPHWKLATLSAN